MTTRIRELRPDDWAAVRAIYEEGIRGGDATFETEPPSWRDWDAAHPELRLVAEDDGTVVGWAALSPASSRSCYRGVGEASVYVAAVARGAGVGRALLLDADGGRVPRERGVAPAPPGMRLPRGGDSRAAR